MLLLFPFVLFVVFVSFVVSVIVRCVCVFVAPLFLRWLLLFPFLVLVVDLRFACVRFSLFLFFFVCC